ncbi:MAG: chromosome partition protein MukE [Bacteroidetes bacterium]|nr:chromosome partition protein MukE [Bacteroidota bacterium]
MENESVSKEELDLSFLMDELSKAHFADLNISLLRGAHVQSDDHYLHHLLTQYEGPIAKYYEVFYSLRLAKERFNSETFFYLDFFEESKGKISHQSRHRELTEFEVIIGISLLKMYYDRYFEQSKDITWEDIRKEIKENENSSYYKQIFFNSVREDYSDPEWKVVKTKIVRALGHFEVLGWIKRNKEVGDNEIHFKIKESIHRFATLYKEALENFEKFVEIYKQHNDPK